MDDMRPVILAVDDDAEACDHLRHELGRRYGSDYEIIVERSPVSALAAFAAARARLSLLPVWLTKKPPTWPSESGGA